MRLGIYSKKENLFLLFDKKNSKNLEEEKGNMIDR